MDYVHKEDEEYKIPLLPLKKNVLGFSERVNWPFK